jgi:MYXO-CTERM domain-containing protein
MKRLLLGTCLLATAALAASASAAPQVWPFAFDAGLDGDAAASIQQQLTTGAAALPPLPVSELTTLTTDTGTMTLWFWPENAALLTGIGGAGPDPMIWPSTPVMCAKHAAFVMPVLATDDAGTCAAVASQITQAIVPNLSACILTEQPELYVLGYSPADVASDVGNIEDMIGLAGEALTHAGPPLTGILPAPWVPTLRTILDKIRDPKLVAALGAATAGYGQATGLLSANTSCFDPTVAANLTTSLAGLTSEVATITTYLQNLEAAGEAASAQENTCLAAVSRVRETLPYPSLTETDREFVAFWLGGTYWRMRGGGLIPLGSTQEARLYYVEDGFGQIAALVGGADGQNNTGVSFFLELVSDGWAEWQAMGTNGDDKYADIIGMTERGQRQVAVDINGLEPLGYDTGELLSGALQMGPGYYYAYYPLSAFRYAPDLTPPYSGFIDWPTAIGEFNIGAALGLGLARTLLPGKPTGQPPTVTLCSGRACGDDGCGGSCGTCAAGLVCDAAGACGAAPDDAGAPDATAGSSADDGGSGVGSDDASGPSLSSSGDGSALTTPAAGGDAAAGAGETGNEGGCGCAVAGAHRGTSSMALFASGALVLARRRRRKRSSSKTP